MLTYRGTVPRRVLFLRNDPTAPEALLGEAFTESGFQITTFDVVGSDQDADPDVVVSFPDPTGFDAIVPLGSRWGVNDGLRWIAGEMAVVRSALAAGVGVLGVCFGGQLLAAALGGTVTRSPCPEIGWYEVHSTEPALVPPGRWFQWHFDRFSPPPGATVLARNDQATQAFVSGRALGLQFHPEVDPELVRRWVDGETAAELARLGVDPAELLRRTGAMADDAARRLRILVRGFLRLLEDDSGHQAGGHR